MIEQLLSNEVFDIGLRDYTSMVVDMVKRSLELMGDENE